MYPRESGWRPWASTRLHFSARPASRRMKSRPSRGNHWRRSGADDTSISPTTQDLRLFLRAPPPALPEPAIPANLTVINDPEPRTDGILEGAPNDSGIALKQARANIPWHGTWRYLARESRQRAKAGRQHHRWSRTRHSRLRSPKGRRVRYGRGNRGRNDFRHAYHSR